ncbi:hypothetical protein [Ornithinimicrobium avium]|uniref:hypothetical protein n=1 Tax=Ornithinimicrobium avium TaxID=2283195 RepID=UPI00192DDF70|nr:hypothetical protein [Ornithinimicrobium avium]
MPPTVKKILHWLVWGFLIYAIITNPDRAADILRAVWDIISQSILNIGRFFNSLMGS